MGSMSANLNHLNDSLGRIAHLSHRVAAGLMLMMGVPRVLSSGLYHGLVTAGDGGKGGKGGGWSGWDPNKSWEDNRRALEQEKSRIFEEEQKKRTGLKRGIGSPIEELQGTLGRAGKASPERESAALAGQIERAQTEKRRMEDEYGVVSRMWEKIKEGRSKDQPYTEEETRIYYRTHDLEKNLTAISKTIEKAQARLDVLRVGGEAPTTAATGGLWGKIKNFFGSGLGKTLLTGAAVAGGISLGLATGGMGLAASVGGGFSAGPGDYDFSQGGGRSTWECPGCKRLNSNDRIVCKFCGTGRSGIPGGVGPSASSPPAKKLPHVLNQPYPSNLRNLPSIYSGNEGYSRRGARNWAVGQTIPTATLAPSYSLSNLTKPVTPSSPVDMLDPHPLKEIGQILYRRLIAPLGDLFRNIFSRMRGWFGKGPPEDPVKTDEGGEGGKDPGKKGIELEKSGLYEGFMKATDGVTQKFLGLSAAAGGLIRAASPDTFATFTMSLQLLAATVGTTLIPMFVRWSLYAQQAAFSFEARSEKTKELVGDLIEFGVALTGAVVAARLAAVGFKAMFSGPGLLGLGVLAGYGAYSSYQEVKEAQKKREEERAKAGGPFDREEVEKFLSIDPVDQRWLKQVDIIWAKNRLIQKKGPNRFGEMPPLEEVDETITAPWQRQMELNLQEAMELEKFADNVRGGELHQTLFKTYSKIPFVKDLGEWYAQQTGQVSREEIANKTEAEIKRNRKAAGVYRALLDYAKTGTFFEDPVKEETKDVERTDLARQMLFTIQSLRVNPRYQAVEEAYKNVQMEAIGRTPLEQTLDQMVRQNLLKMFERMGEQLGVQKETNQILKSLEMK